jgi:hypothetical protein
MKPANRALPVGRALARTEVFVALAHSLAITCMTGSRWAVSVDGDLVPGTFRSQAEAWAAGVREADTRNRQRSA